MNYRFMKKPVTIEAFQMTAAARRDNSEWPFWLHMAWNTPQGDEGSLYPSTSPSDGEDLLLIMTLEGEHLVSWDDWIIKGVKGELYPCKPDIFEMTYDPCE